MNTKMKESIYVLGTGHNTPVYIDLAEACGYVVKGLYHYNHDKDGLTEYGYPILGSFEDLLKQDTLAGLNFALSQGNNSVRADIFNRIMAKNGNIPTMVHPSANVSQYATLGQGVVVHMNAIIHPDVIVGENTVFSCNTTIIHTVEIGKHCYFAAGSIIGAYSKIEDYVFAGLGSTSISAKVEVIGTHAYVGAGSVITKCVEPYTVVAGVPAKTIKRIEH